MYKHLNRLKSHLQGDWYTNLLDKLRSSQEDGIQNNMYIMT